MKNQPSFFTCFKNVIFFLDLIRDNFVLGGVHLFQFRSLPFCDVIMP